MTRAECLRILQLPASATPEEIKRQYKKMALLYHPDRNPDPKAHEAFILISKAVELLANPDLLEGTLPTKQTRASRNETPEEIAVRMKEAKQRFQQQQVKKQEDDLRYFQFLTSGKKWVFFKAVVFAGFILALMLSFETFLPKHYEKDQLSAISPSQHNGIFFNNICAIELKNHGIYFAKVNRPAWSTSYSNVFIETAWFTHTPLKMIGTDDSRYYWTNFDFHIGSIKWLLVIVFLLPLHPFLIRRKNINFVFLYHFTLYFVSTLEVYLLLTHDRIWHVLTLGFL